jgi:hypothetical protein
MEAKEIFDRGGRQDDILLGLKVDAPQMIKLTKDDFDELDRRYSYLKVLAGGSQGVSASLG